MPKTFSRSSPSPYWGFIGACNLSLSHSQRRRWHLYVLARQSRGGNFPLFASPCSPCMGKRSYFTRLRESSASARRLDVVVVLVPGALHSIPLPLKWSHKGVQFHVLEMRLIALSFVRKWYREGLDHWASGDDDLALASACSKQRELEPFLRPPPRSLPSIRTLINSSPSHGWVQRRRGTKAAALPTRQDNSYTDTMCAPPGRFIVSSLPSIIHSS